MPDSDDRDAFRQKIEDVAAKLMLGALAFADSETVIAIAALHLAAASAAQSAGWPSDSMLEMYQKWYKQCEARDLADECKRLGERLIPIKDPGDN